MYLVFASALGSLRSFFAPVLMAERHLSESSDELRRRGALQATFAVAALLAGTVLPPAASAATPWTHAYAADAVGVVANSWCNGPAPNYPGIDFGEIGTDAKPLVFICPTANHPVDRHYQPAGTWAQTVSSDTNAACWIIDSTGACANATTAVKYNCTAHGGTLTNSFNDAWGYAHEGWCLPYAGIHNDTGCKCEQPQPGQQQPRPINTGSGNEFESVTDYHGGGAFPLVFSRTYNSGLSARSVENIGNGWSTNIGGYLTIAPGGQSVLCQDPRLAQIYLCPVSLSSQQSIEVTVWGADGSQNLFTYIASTAPDGTALTGEQTTNGQLFFVASLPAPATGSGFRYVRRNGNTEYYTSSGQLVAITNIYGLTQTYQYNSSNQLTSVTDPFGRQLSFAYDTSGRIQTVTTPAGAFTYSYDTHGNLTSVTYPDSNKVQYVYGNSSFPNALTGLIDENKTAVNSTVQYSSWGYDNKGFANSTQLAGAMDKSTIVYTRDNANNVTSAQVTEPTGLVRTLTFTTVNFNTLITGSSAPCVECGDRTASFTYDTNGFIASKTDFDGNVTQYTHDAYGNETSRTEGYGSADARTITTHWDLTHNQPDLITEPGRTTAYTYDTVGHVLTKTVTDTATSVARTTTYTYYTSGAAAGLLNTVDGPRTDVSDITTYAYDTQGNLSTITNALGQMTQITSYDANGMPLTIVDPNNVTTALTYDARQRILSKTVNGTELTQFTYDNAGELIKVTQPDGSYLQYTYDDAHRLTRVTDSLGNYISYTLDNLGNRKTEKTYDPSNNLTRTLSRTYNTLNQLLTVVGGMSQTTTYTDDTVGNTTSIKDPMLNVTGQGFDALNRLMSVVDPATGNTTYHYDALDHVQDVTDPRGLNTHYDDDAFGDVIEQDSPDTGITSYTYDLAGNRLTKLDASGVTATYTYDALNRLMSVSYPDITKDVTYSYDSGTYGKGHLTGIADASGTTAYTYDAYGNLTQKVVVEGGQTFTVGYGYDLANNLSSVTYPDGMVVAYSRDADGRITGVTENGNAVVSGIGYKPFGPVSGLTYGNGLIETRSYDLDYRLIGISIPAIQGLTFGYNANDDITGITDSISASNTQTLGYDSLNRLTSAVSGSGGYGSLTYGYDADGNRISLINGAGTATYTLDTNNNQLDSISGATAATYGYNAIGALDDDGTNQYTYADTERLDTVTNISTSATVATYVYNGLGQRTEKTTSAGTSLFVYDEDGQLLGEYDGSGNRMQEHIWLNHRPVGVIDSTALYYVQTDQLNTPRVITDASHAVVWSWNSDPFGNAAASGSLTYNLRFAGQYLDAESGYSYNYERDYDPSRGRYIESDPIGLDGGLNTYRYALNDPLGKGDPKGEVPNAAEITCVDPVQPICWGGVAADAITTLLPIVGGVLSLSGDTPADEPCDKAQQCEQQLEREEALCEAIAGSRYPGDPSRAIGVCKRAAFNRYAQCLKGVPESERQPLTGVVTPI